jgi:hypothetical protein
VHAKSPLLSSGPYGVFPKRSTIRPHMPSQHLIGAHVHVRTTSPAILLDGMHFAVVKHQSCSSWPCKAPGVMEPQDGVLVSVGCSTEAILALAMVLSPHLEFPELSPGRDSVYICRYCPVPEPACIPRRPSLLTAHTSPT